MKEEPEEVLEIFLQPGELFFGEGATRIRTLLGSCVAITLWHPRRKFGGMCHFLLPSRPGGPKGGKPDARYADEAMTLFLAEIARTGTRCAGYEAMLVGGGDQYPGVRTHPSRSVSQRNLEAARELTRRHGIRVKAENMGGVGARNVIFDLRDGSVWVKALGTNPAAAAKPRKRER